MINFINYFWGPESSWFWTMLQTVVICISLFLILRQITIQRHGNMISLVYNLKEKYNSAEFRKSRQQLCRKFIQNNLQFDRSDQLILTFFEEMGIYVKKNIFDADNIWELYSNEIEYYWPISAPIVMELRAKRKDNTFYNHFEYLYKLMMKISRKKGAGFQALSKDDLLRFSKQEIKKKIN